MAFHNELTSSLLSNNKPLWGDLGVALNPTIMTSADALEAAGLANWNLEKRPLYFNTSDALDLDVNVFQEVKGKVAVVRPTDNAFLGAVGSQYQIVPNEEALAWGDALVQDHGCIYERAGTFNGGEGVWMVARTPFTITPPDGHPVSFYLLMTTGHNGKWSIKAQVIPIRDICLNTITTLLRSAIKSIQTNIFIAHTSGAPTRYAQASVVIDQALQGSKELAKVAAFLYQQKITGAEWDQLLRTLFPVVADGEHERSDYFAEEARGIVTSLYHTAPGQQGQPDTAWKVYQTIEEYNNHYRTGRGDRIEEARMQRLVNVGAKSLPGLTLALLGINN